MGNKSTKRGIKTKKIFSKIDSESKDIILQHLKPEELEVLIKIFSNLAERSSSNTINEKSFHVLFKLPGILNERLWQKFVKIG